MIYLTRLSYAKRTEHSKAIQVLLGKKRSLSLESISEVLLLFIPAEGDYEDSVISRIPIFEEFCMGE